MLDLELRRLEFRSGRIRLRRWFTRTYLLWNGLPCHCPLPWQATRLRYSATCIQAAQHVFRHSRDCLPMGRLVWLQRWFRTWCQVSTRLNSCARGNPQLIVQTRSFSSLRAVMAIVVTNLSASVGGLTWMIMDWRLERKWSAIGFCSGAISGRSLFLCSLALVQRADILSHRPCRYYPCRWLRRSTCRCCHRIRDGIFLQLGHATKVHLAGR